MRYYLLSGRTDRIVLIYIGIVFFLKGFVFFWVRIVLKGSKIVFFLNMGEEWSFTNILDRNNIYKVERITKYILFYCGWERIIGI